MGKTGARLHFLHAYNPNLAVLSNNRGGGTLVFTCTVHYTDGSTVDIPIRWKQEIANWYDRGVLLNKLRASGNASIAWFAGNPFDWKGRPGTLALCHYAWDNPSPGKTVSHISIISANTEEIDLGAPLIVAISASE